MEDVIVLKNEKKQGIEIYFKVKPETKILEALKQNHFRWHNVKKCWYAKENENSENIINKIINGKKIETIKSNEIKLKSIRRATNEEVQEIAKSKWDTEKMQKYIIETYDYYILATGEYIELEKVKKWGINKTLWFDDETEEPQNTYKNFEIYNKMNDKTLYYIKYLEAKKEFEQKRYGIGNYDYKGLWLCGSYVNTKQVGISFVYEKNNFIRYLTDEEQEDFIKLINLYHEKYIERLQKYWKRYSKYVHWSGYWANR